MERGRYGRYPVVCEQEGAEAAEQRNIAQDEDRVVREVYTVMRVLPTRFSGTEYRDSPAHSPWLCQDFRWRGWCIL